MQKDLTRKYQTSLQTFTDTPQEDQAELQRFAFICMLCFDVYMKKQLIEHMIDGRIPEMGKAKKSSEKSKKADN